MRVAILSLIFLFAVIPPLNTLAAQVETIDELAQIVNSEKCAECHEDIHEKWQESWHAKSIVDSRVLRTWRTFILSGLDKSPAAKRRDLKDVCLPCHAPVTQYASDALVEKITDLIVTAVEDKDSAKREIAIKELSKLNINCIVCHNMKAVADGNPKPKTIYGPGISEEEPPHKEEFGFDTVKTAYLKTSEFCGSCHHGCPPDMPSSICPTLYTSYKEQYLAHGGDKTCQECHMVGEDGENHRFPGMFELDFAKQGIDLKLSASSTEYVYHLENRLVPAVVTNIQVKNTSGHGMPHG